MEPAKFLFFQQWVIRNRTSFFLFFALLFLLCSPKIVYAAESDNPFLKGTLNGISISFGEKNQTQPGRETSQINPPSSDLLLQVDKQHGISDYVPGDLVELSKLGAPQKFIRQTVLDPLQTLLEEMQGLGIPIKIISAYRSFNTQKSLFYGYLRTYGNEARRFSAPPGHSEHQLGTAIDFGIEGSRNLTASFAQTAQGKWLEEHAWEYGFAESYPSGKEVITGYIYEPWHYRFVGIEASTKLHQSWLTLSQLLKINSANNILWAYLPLYEDSQNLKKQRTVIGPSEFNLTSARQPELKFFSFDCFPSDRKESYQTTLAVFQFLS